MKMVMNQVKFIVIQGGVMLKRIINLWIKMIKSTCSIDLSHSPGRPCTVRAEANISKAKWRRKQKKHVSTEYFKDKRIAHTAGRSSFVPLQANQTTEID